MTAPSTVAQLAEQSHSPSRRDYLPLKITLIYLGGTYLIFLAFGRSNEAEDLFSLSVFILYTLIAFTVGYSAWVSRNSRKHPIGKELLAADVDGGESPPRVLITACVLYYFATSILYLARAGGLGLSTLWFSITHPGDSYFAKLHPDTAPTESLTVQIFTLFAVLYALLIPLAVSNWKKLGVALRLLVLAGISIYVIYFLSVGTTKGLGDMLVFWCAAFLVLRQRASIDLVTKTRSQRLREIAVAAVAIGAFASYMSYSQADRLDVRDQTSRFPGNPTVAAVFGEKFASGLAVTVDYPTHGYLGLSYNLQTPFVWTYGVGSAPAVSDYVEKYLGTDQPIRDRYTARTADRTGWPDGMFWSTIYPWLASDITFPGTVIFMAFVGWFTAKFWREALDGRMLSLALFCQLALLLVFVPANNQVGQGRPSLVGFLTLCALSVNDRIRIRRRVAKSHGASA